MSLKRALANSKGKIFYGMHCYPGVARYEPPNAEPFTVLLNEKVIRNMGPSFAGKPIFVQHVEEVEQDLDALRAEVDGWVIESFFNQADGKTWAKFIVVSDKGLEAIRDGWRLSNAYFPECEETPGTWNGVPYQRVVVDGEFEHLAIVQNPRYEESVIMTPEQFKAYNEKQTVELKRLANSKDKKGENAMGLKIFKRQKIENAPDLDGVIVELPKSKKEVLITKAIEEYDKLVNMNGYANGDHMVKVGDKEEMSVNDLVKKHMEVCNSLAEMQKAKNAEDDGAEVGDDGEGIINEDGDMDDDSMENDAQDVSEGMSEVGDRGGDASLDNEDEDKSDEDKVVKKAKNSKDVKLSNEKKKQIAREKAKRLANAHLNAMEEDCVEIALPEEQVARGQSLYGSN